MKATTHFLPEQQISKLKAESKKTGINVSELIRRAIDAYLQSRPK